MTRNAIGNRGWGFGAFAIGWCLFGWCLFGSASIGSGQDVAAGQASETADVIVVVGAPGQPEYESEFERWAGRWQQAAERAGASFTRIGLVQPEASEASLTDRERLIAALREHAGEETTPLWVVLIGHGTFYREVAKFNLVGPDLSAQELADQLRPVRRPTVIINTASASGPFINRLSQEGRVVVTATKSGAEINYARFGDFLSSAVGSEEADLDHDGEVSVLEAFLHANAAVRQFYESESRLSTEHALLDDNGDGRGTPASLYRGLRVEGKVKDGAEADGRLARRMILAPAAVALPFTETERQQRNQIERAVEELRLRKETLDEAEYFAELESLMLPLAKLYRQVEQRAAQQREEERESPEKAEPQEPAEQAEETVQREEAAAEVEAPAGETTER